MELSILIPKYRFDCSQLVSDLRAQGDALGIAYEIVVEDDEQLRLGRARIRNRLAEEASGEWLLFIDCDAAVDDADFLRRYLDAAAKAPVVCGGLRHAATLPSPEVSLRWRYEHAADRHRSAAERSRHPYAHFTPFNFMIRRELFLQIRFDEACREYGHEDTLFGAELERRGISVLHIDNPLVHIGLEPNAVFLDKSRAALRSLHALSDRLRSYSTLLPTYQRLESWGFAPLLRGLWRRCNARWERRLTENVRPSLTLFKLYKLAYYSQL